MNSSLNTRRGDGGRRDSQLETMQRWGALLAGGTLAVIGLSRRSKGGLVLAGAGGALAYAGAKTTRTSLYPVAASSITVNVSPQEAYRMWRNFEELPLFMRHLESVTVLGDRCSKWVAIGPMGTRIQWTAEIVADREGELIAWRSLPGSDITVNGSVQFRPAVGNRGSVINAVVQYQLPAGSVGRAFLKILSKDPRFLMEQDLRRFKALIETGEIPTTEGQTHGRRSMVAAAARLADPDAPLPRNSNIVEVLQAKRRAS